MRYHFSVTPTDFNRFLENNYRAKEKFFDYSLNPRKNYVEDRRVEEEIKHDIIHEEKDTRTV